MSAQESKPADAKTADTKKDTKPDPPIDPKTQPQPTPATASGQKDEKAGSDVRYEPVVDPERTQQADTLSFREVNGLPINRRNYLDLATLTPGVVTTADYVGISDAPLSELPDSGLAFANNGRGNVFWLDGAENYVNEGDARPSISQQAVAEFHVARMNYSAEFGGGIGFIVNIVSRSGSDNFHGDVFGFLRQRELQARNYFDLAKSAFTRSQTGGTLGGPLRKNRTSFFIAFERLQREETAFVPITRDPALFTTLTASQQQLVNFFDASGNAQLGFLGAAMQQALLTSNFPHTVALFNANSGEFPFQEAFTQGSARVDHQFSDNHHGF